MNTQIKTGIDLFCVLQGAEEGADGEGGGGGKGFEHRPSTDALHRPVQQQDVQAHWQKDEPLRQLDNLLKRTVSLGRLFLLNHELRCPLEGRHSKPVDNLALPLDFSSAWTAGDL